MDRRLKEQTVASFAVHADLETIRKTVEALDEKYGQLLDATEGSASARTKQP